VLPRLGGSHAEVGQGGHRSDPTGDGLSTSETGRSGCSGEVFGLVPLATVDTTKELAATLIYCDEMLRCMWIRPAALTDMPYCLSADTRIGVVADRTVLFHSAIADGGVFLTGRSHTPEGILVSAVSFFSRPFISLLFVELAHNAPGEPRIIR
jgi:hypothetical protein